MKLNISKQCLEQAVRRHRIAFACMLVLACYTVLGMFAGPVVAKKLLVHSMKNAGLDTVLERVRVNPFTFVVSVDGLSARDAAAKPLVSFTEMVINFRAASLWRQAVLLDEVMVDGPELFLDVDAEGKHNVSKLFGAQKKSESGSMRFGVERLSINGGRVSYSAKTRSVPFAISLNNVLVSVAGFDSAGQKFAEFSVNAETPDEERLKWSGKLGINPFRAETRIELEQIQLVGLWRYFGLRPGWSIAAGRGSAAGSIFADASKTPAEWTVDAERLSLRDVEIRMDESGELLAAVPEFVMETGKVVAAQKSVSIAGASVNNCSFFLRRKTGEAGAFYEFAGYEKEKPSVVPPEEAAAGSNLNWNVTAPVINVRNCRVVHEDQTLPKAVVAEVSGITLMLRQLAFSPGAPFDISGEALINSSGRLKFSGGGAVLPLRGMLKAEAEGVLLAPFQSYIEPFARISLSNGTLAGEVKAAFDETQEMPLALDAEAQINDFVLQGAEDQRRLFSFKHILFRGAQLQWPSRLTVGEIVLAEPWLFVERNEKSVLNFVDLIKKNDEVQQEVPIRAEAAPLQAKSTVFQWNAVKTRIENGSIQFVDRAVRPAAEFELKNLDAETGLISNKDGGSSFPAKITARLVPDSALKAAASVDFKQRAYFEKFQFELKNAYFPGLSPYVAQYAGRLIDDGDLSVKLDYRARGSELQGENTLVARGLRFGAGVDSPNAVSLPLELAASLLRDQSGVIHIDFPVRGNLNSPQFSFGSVFVRALTNVLTSVVAAPFNLFAALAGSSRSLDRCYFAFGEAELGSEEQLRLGDLAKALLDRPAVSLAIVPLYDPVHDKLALAEKKRKSREKEDNGDDAGKNGERDVLLETIIIPESELTALAKERALSVQRYLESKGIPAPRLAVREVSAQKVESAQMFVPMTVSGQ